MNFLTALFFKIKLSLLFFVFFNFHHIESTVFNIRILQNQNKQRIFLFCDMHRDFYNGTKSKQQQAEFLYYAKKMNAHVIVEDLLTYDGSNHALKDLAQKYSTNLQSVMNGEAYFLKPTETIDGLDFYTDFFLGSLIQKCKYKKISCYNAECRYWPLLDEENKEKKSKQIIDLYRVAVDQIRQKLDN